jgi:uncharacterized NAD(P)/FAD-binding protein YdhS
MEHRLAIIGGGPRATYLLLHLLAAWKARPMQGRLRVTMIEPVEFGAGAIYCTSQPDFLRLNTIASQVTAFPDDTVVSPLNGLRGPTFYDWARAQDNDLTANGYPSRRDTGRYFVTVFRELCGHAPANVTVECLPGSAVAMRKRQEHDWTIGLADGQEIHADAVVLAVGCAASEKTEAATLANAFGLTGSRAAERLIARPYPIERTLARLQPKETVGLHGFGLSALDIIRAGTVGRGGKYRREKGKFRYLASGNEPQFVAWSRSGLPLMARAVNQKPIDHKVSARFLTEAAIDDLREQRMRKAGTPKLDFVHDLLPLLVREMEDAHKLAFSSGLASLEAEASKFSWQQLVCPMPKDAVRTPDGYRSFLLNYLRQDIEEAQRGNVSSPVKAACDVIRDLRDKLRYAVEFGGLTPNTHRYFDTEFTPIHNRLAVGPPIEAMQELLALVEAGIVDPFCGPRPRLHCDAASGRLYLHPSAFPGPGREVSVVVNARLGATDVAKTAAPLVRHLLTGGHVVPFVNALSGTAYRPGGIAVTNSYRVIDKHARAHDNLFAIGAITEGCTWYCQVLARPYVNSRSMRDAAVLAQSLWEYFADRPDVAAGSAFAGPHEINGMDQTQEAEALPGESPALAAAFVDATTDIE